MFGMREMVLLASCTFSAGVALHDAGGAILKASSGKCAPQPNSYGIGNRATCTFTRVLDIDSHRIPPEIPSVKCKCPGNLCSPTGDFRCQEVREKIKVSYPRWNGGSLWSLQNKTVDVTTACVCAMNRAVRADDDGDRTLDVMYNTVR
nr:interleukin cytokine-related protein 17.1-like [Dermacentor andersoni]